MTLRELGPSTRLISGALGYAELGHEDGWHRWQVSADPSRASVAGRWLDLAEVPDAPRGACTGAIHHLAFRVEDDTHEQLVRQAAIDAGAHPTPVIDRFWFRSVYFKEPGGVLFELATDGPGFAVDEDPAHLGERLVLPPGSKPSVPRSRQTSPPSGCRRPPNCHRKGLRRHDPPPPVPTGDPNRTVLLLHGTGGDEHDLIGLGRELAPGASLLSPRGAVLEGGMPRFFRRLAPGVFDEADLRARTHDLAQFVRNQVADRGLDPKAVWAVGYSNGANIAAALLLLEPDVLAGAVLLRPVLPLEPDDLPDLSAAKWRFSPGATTPGPR